MGADMSSFCQCEPRRAVSSQIDDDRGPESEANLIQRGPVSSLSQDAQAGQNGRAGQMPHRASIPRVAKVEKAPEEVTAKEILQELVELTKYQADLKARKEAGWKYKMEQADKWREGLLPKLAEANRARQDKPKQPPVKFERLVIF